MKKFLMMMAIVGAILFGSTIDVNAVTTADSSAAPAALRVSGAALTDTAGQPVRLQGVSSHGLSWYPEYVNRDALRQMKEEWNCNVFRLAMYTDNYNGYCVGSEENRTALKALIDQAVQGTEALGMYVIIDWHILSDGNPHTYKEQAAAFFQEMSAKYADKKHVIYEICNEPNGAVTWADIKTYAETVIPVIRANTDAVILVGTPFYSQEIHLTAADPLQGYENIMYTFHFYAATHRDELRNRVEAAVQGGLPVFISEFGICDASGNGAVDEAEANRWMEVLERYNISYVLWNLSNKQESSAMILNSCQKTSGFTYEELSQTGKWFVNHHSTGNTASAAVGSGKL